MNPRTSLRIFLICFLLAALVLAIYLPVLGYGFLAYDDQGYVSQNGRVTSGLTLEGIRWAFTTTRIGNWVPLTWLSHMLAVDWFGLDPGLHHALNLGLHAANAMLLFLVLYLMTGAPWRSALVASLFAAHPLHVESVAWISERKDVLFTLFWLLAILAYIRYLRRPGAARYALVVLAFLLSLLSKPMAVTLPLVLLALDGWPLGRWRRLAGQRGIHPSPLRQPPPNPGAVPRGFFAGRPVREKLPLLLIAAAYGIFTLVWQTRAGVVGTWEAFPLFSRLANAVQVLVSYLVRMLWPAGLAAFYPHPGTAVDWRWTLMAVAFLILLTWLAVRSRVQRPHLILGWGWYLTTLLPVLGLVQVGDQAMADRYTYVPLIGPFIALAWLPAGTRRRRILSALIAAAAVTGLALAARNQVRWWRDTGTLFRRAVDVVPGNWLAHYHLGTVLAGEGKASEALGHFREVVRLKPAAVKPRFRLAETYDALGRYREAADIYLKELAGDPKSARGHFGLGLSLERLGMNDEAIRRYREALRLDPGLVPALNNLGTLLARRGDREEAARLFREAIRLDPGSHQVWMNLEQVLR